MQTLVLTDIATGWTECAPLIVREQNAVELLSTALTELRNNCPLRWSASIRTMILCS